MSKPFDTTPCTCPHCGKDLPTVWDLETLIAMGASAKQNRWYVGKDFFKALNGFFEVLKMAQDRGIVIKDARDYDQFCEVLYRERDARIDEMEKVWARKNRSNKKMPHFIDEVYPL